MKNTIKKIITVCMLLVMIIGILPVSQVQAASPKIEKEIRLRLYNAGKSTTISSYISIQNAKGGSITKLKNENSFVANVSVSKYNKTSLMVEPKAAGTTKVSFHYAGKKFTTKLIVTKWVNPCKEFKIGNKDYAKNFNKSEQYNLNRQKGDTNQKIKITPKKGWKLIKIEKGLSPASKKIQNNSNVYLSTKDTGTAIFAYFKNKQTKETQRLYFGYSDFDFPSGNIYNIRVDK